MSLRERATAHKLYKFALQTGLVRSNPAGVSWNNRDIYETNKDKIIEFLETIGYDEDEILPIGIDEFPSLTEVKNYFKQEARRRGYKGPTNYRRMGRFFNRKYNIRITVKWERKEVGGSEWERQDPKMFESIQTETKSQDEDVFNLVQRWWEGRPEEYNRIVDIKVQEVEQETQYNWSTVPLRRANNRIIRWSDKNGEDIFDQNFSDNGTCVYDYLEKLSTTKQGKQYRYKKLLGDRSQIETEMPALSLFDEEAKGVSADELYQYCVNKDIGCYLVDSDSKIRLSHTSKKNKNTPSIIGMCAYGHFYPIKSKPVRKTITESAKSLSHGIGGKMFYNKIKEQHNNTFDRITILEKDSFPVSNPKGLYIYKSTEDMLNQFLHFIIEENTSYRHTSNSRGITSIFHNEWTFYLNPLIDSVKKFMTIEKGNESLYQVYKPVLDELELNETDYYTTFCSKNIHESIVKDMVKSAFNYTDEITKTDITVDKNKAYSYVFKNMKSLLVASPIDIPKIYSKDIQLEENNIYYVKNPSKNLLGQILIDQEGWYINDIVKTSLENKYISHRDITKYMCCSDSKTNPFPTFIDKLYEKYGNDAKLLVNSFIGTFGRTHTDAGHIYINNSLDKIIKYDVSQFREKNIITNKNGKVYNFYTTIVPKTVPRYSTGILINSQIVQTNRHLIYDMTSKMLSGGGILRNISTDSITISNPSYIPPNEPNNFNGWKLEQTKPQKKFVSKVKLKKVYRKIDRDYNKCRRMSFENEWDTDKCVEQILSHDANVIITGYAGCGKSHIIKKLETKDPNSTIIIAPTHVAKSNFHKAETIHSFLCIDAEGNKTSKRNYKNLKYVIIDEVSMVGMELFKHLLRILHEHKHIKVFVFGDFEQLQAVNDFSDFKLWTRFCKYHYQLVENKRTENKEDIEYFNVMKKARENEMIDYNFDSKENDLNLCYTNAKRKQINAYFMEKYKPKDALFFEVKDEEDSYYQSMYIYEGMPLLLKKSFTKKNVFNGFRFIIEKINDGKIIMKCLQNGGLVEFTFSEVKKNFVPCYAMTIHCSQGQTFTNNYTIHEINKLDSRLLYVALSRSKKLNQISISN